MMLDYMGWKDAADMVRIGVREAIRSKTVTYDLARQITGATEVSCSAFGKAIVEKMKTVQSNADSNSKGF
jgi:isocitrate dehydrogenase